MEPRKTSSLRRKPLSDCTNTVAATRRNPPPSAAKSAAVLVKPPKSSNSSAATRRNPPASAAKSAAVLVKPPKSSNSSAAVSTTNKLNPPAADTATTSTGSNISPNDPSVPSDPPAPPTPLSDSDVRERRKSGLPASQSQRQDEKTRTDKGKMILETPVAQALNPFTPRMLELSSSAASGYCHLSGLPAVSSKKLEAQTTKDKGKMVLEASNIKASDPITPHAAVLISATSTSDVRERRKSGLPTSQSQRQDEITRTDKGKMILETPVAQALNPFTPRTLELSSSAASGNCPLSGPPAFSSKKLAAQTMKDKRKMVLEASNIKASDPITPHATVMLAGTSTSGIRDQERLDFLTVYNQRKHPRRREDADGENVLPLSCPPGKRTKKKGVQPDDGRGGKHSGSHTDPVPVHKKRSRNKRDDNVHAMPQDEIERLKSYFADIDAFELPEEVASESD